MLWGIVCADWLGVHMHVVIKKTNPTTHRCIFIWFLPRPWDSGK